MFAIVLSNTQLFLNIEDDIAQLSSRISFGRSLKLYWLLPNTLAECFHSDALA